MKIPVPNFTQIPNVLTDEMLPSLGFAELKVLLVVFRHTFGWHRTRDKISLSQFERATGLERRHILKAVKGLMNKNLIRKEVTGPKSAKEATYELIIGDNSKKFTQCPKDTPPSVFRTPTKERELNKLNKSPKSPYPTEWEKDLKKETKKNRIEILRRQENNSRAMGINPRAQIDKNKVLARKVEKCLSVQKRIPVEFFYNQGNLWVEQSAKGSGKLIRWNQKTESFREEFMKVLESFGFDLNLPARSGFVKSYEEE